MADFRKGTTKRVVLSVTDDDAIDTRTATADAIAVRDGSVYLPVSLVTKTPAAGNSNNIELALDVEMSSLGAGFAIEVESDRIKDADGTAAASTALQSALRVYDSLEFVHDGSNNAFNGQVVTSSNTPEWNLLNADNSTGSASIVGDTASFTFNTADTHLFGVQYFGPLTEIRILDNSKVTFDADKLQDTPSLEVLSIPGSNADLSSVDFSLLPALDDLDVANTPGSFTDANLAQLTGLTRLSFGGTGSTFTGAAISQLTSANRLNLSSCNVSMVDADLAALGGTLGDLDLSGVFNAGGVSPFVFYNLGGLGALNMSFVGWDGNNLGTMLTALADVAFGLGFINIGGNPGTFAIDTSGSSGYQRLQNRGVFVLRF